MGMGFTANGHRISFWGDECVLKMLVLTVGQL